MDDRQARTLDTTIKVIGVLLAVAGFWDGVRRYNEGRATDAAESRNQERQAIDAARRESRKPFLERQLTLYFEATNAAAQLSTLPQSPEWKAARQRFYELYWGELGLVEDSTVERAMVRFERALVSFEGGKGPQAELTQHSLSLAHACRQSLQGGWGGLDSLPLRLEVQ